MTSEQTPEQQLERWAQRTLNDVPPRRAPRTLAPRVLEAIERRAALPWWRRNFAAWPMAARVSFLAISLASVKGALMLATWLMGEVHSSPVVSAVSPELIWMDSFVNAVQAVIAGIPDGWLQWLLLGFAVLYGTLFGLGTAAYRTLYARR